MHVFLMHEIPCNHLTPIDAKPSSNLTPIIAKKISFYEYDILRLKFKFSHLFI
jgi:hypothetical protein